MSYNPNDYGSSDNNNDTYDAGNTNNEGQHYYGRPPYDAPPPYGNAYNGYDSQPPYGGYVKIVPHNIWNREKQTLKRMSMAAGSAIILYIVFSGLFSTVFQYITLKLSMSSTFDYESFRSTWNSADMQSVINMLYSIIMVGGPFLIIYLMTRNRGINYNIPMGKPKHAKYLPLIVLGGLGVCLLGNIITSYFDMFLETLFGVDIETTEQTLSQEPGGIFLAFLSTAVVPALVEEMALRGVIMQPLRRYGDWFAILCSSMVFAVMHCNLVQIPFAFIAGIVIGYATLTTGSVWTGMLIHFANNTFSLIVSLVADRYGYSSPQYAACNVVFYVLIVIGVACAFFYVRFVNNESMYKSPLVNKSKYSIAPSPYYSAVISNGTLFKTYICTVPMIVALIVVAYETIMALLL